MEGGATTLDTLATFLESMGSIVTSVFTWIGSALNFVIQHPIVYVPLLGFFIVGGAVGILMRVMRG